MGTATPNRAAGPVSEFMKLANLERSQVRVSSSCLPWSMLRTQCLRGQDSGWCGWSRNENTWLLTPVPTRWLRAVGHLFPYHVSGSQWKNEQTGLSDLQFPCQLAYCMLSFGSEGLIFKNNAQIWGTHKVFNCTSTESAFIILSLSHQ